MGLNILIGNMVKHNNVLQSAHLRKHWQNRVKCFFNQPAHKKLRAQKRAARAANLGSAPISRLRPVVFGQTRRYGNKVKFGRGFSLEEIKTAGLTQVFARSVGIAVDHRRHNKNAESMATNVERLTQYKAKLILFPRNADKPKKGEINDSTADELKDVKVYQKLRQERINKRYEGQRIKKAKLAAE